MATVCLEEYDLLGDSKYRSYVAAVDKALKNFEYTSEWADLISALGKLNKVLSSNMRYPVIPKRLTISKRLAQCMHHALPAGVHLKAIETYDIIFKCIGTNRLSQELFIYSAGLFPLLGQAAMKVKPALLTIYETHFVPLRERLRPGLQGFLVGVLPALEENSEFFQRTSELLEQICEGTDPNFFYGALWDCVISNPGARLTAVDFALNHFNKKLSMEDQLYMIGTDIDSMVKALCLAVQDSNILVQRSTLDLLQLCFPMHNSQLLKPDMSKIVTSSILVILRRDMSLNRRLFSWVLGYDNHPPVLKQASVNSVSSEKSINESELDSSSAANHYFMTFSRDLIITAMTNCLKREMIMSENYNMPDLWCYRLLQSLLDKPDIASSVLDEILIQVFRALYNDCNNSKTQESRSNKHSSELLKAANMFFSTLEPDYIWSYISSKFIAAGAEATEEYKELKSQGLKRESILTVLQVGSQMQSLSELCLIVNFLLDVLTLETYMDTPSNHLPEFLKVICNVLTENMTALTPQELTISLSLCSKILSKIQPSLDSPADVPDKQSNILESNVEYNSNTKDVNDNPKSSENLDEETKIKQEMLENAENLDKIYLSHEAGNPIIQQCISSFQEFFLNFFNVHVFVESREAVLKRSSNLVISIDETYEDKQKLLETLLWKCLGVQLNIKQPTKVPSPQKLYQNTHKPLETKTDLNDLSEPFGYACQLLLELSSFPVYCNRATRTPGFSSPENTVHTFLPDWLNLLLLCCCFVENSDFHFISLATILDLISITKGVMQESKKTKLTKPESSGNSSEEKESVVSVKIAPVLTIDQLLYIEKETAFYNIAASKLWNFLGSTTSEHHLKAVQLLVLLQNLSLDIATCEDMLGLAMTQEDDLAQVEAMNKFSVLWHLTRDMKSKLGAMQHTNFDRSLFVMLDNLEKPIGPQKSVAQTWLTHCLQMNDLSRILEPIHLMLLHSDSARVSIQHVQINRPKKVKINTNMSENSESDEAKIYAISSIEGNVIYHVGSEDSKPVSRIGSPERRILALTSILNPSENSNKKGSTKVVTADSMLQEFDLPSLHEQQLVQAPMSLYMNPFGSLLSVASDSGLDSCSTQADLSNAKVVDIAAALRKSSFDMEDADCDTESNSAQTPDSTCNDMSSVEIVTSILNDIISVVTKDDSVTLTAEFCEGEDALLTLENPLANENELNKVNGTNPKDVAIHPLHTHLLLYYQVYDAEKTLYAMSILKTILSTNPRAVLCAMTTTSVCNVQSSRYIQLLSLLVRHKKSVFGKNFHGELCQSDLSSYRSSMYIEVIILICIYYIRGYYPNNLNQMRLSEDDITGNRNVQLMSAEVLTIVFSELLNIVKDSSKSLASYIAEVMTKCKLQKTVLHCLIASVYNASRRRSRTDNGTAYFTEAIVDFNESLGVDVDNHDNNDFSDTLQIQLLRLLLVVIILEDEVFVQKRATDPSSGKSNASDSARSSRIHFVASSTSNKYQQNVHIPGQPMFLSAVLSALKQHHSSSLLTHWMNLVTLSLPYMNKSLSTIVSSVVNQICVNLETKADLYSEQISKSSDGSNVKNPPDYMIVLLDGLTSLCHYCILDNSSQVLTVNQPPVICSSPISIVHPTQIFSNLMHVFSSSDARKSAMNKETTQQVDPIITARKSLLSSLPRIISALASVWNSMKKAEQNSVDSQQQSCWIMGNPKAIKQQILSFVSPISLNHGTNFFGAVALIWHNPKSRNLTSCSWSEKQQLLVDLIGNIKVMPIDTLVQNIRHVMKHPPPTSVDSRKKSMPLEVNILQFFLAYINLTPGSQLVDAWTSLAPLWRDGVQISLPPVQFLLLGILNEYVQKTSLTEDKKEQRELQEIAQKLIDVCSEIAGSSLEQTNWLRRNLAVKSSPQYEGHDFDAADASHAVFEENPQLNEATVSSKASQYSVQALIVLALYVAPLLDVVYVSEEKDKIVPLLSSIMHYVTPYLKNHSKSNVPSFRACSQLLKSLSGYQYTRKAWKKEAFDLLMDPTFFQLDHTSLTYWRPVVDHLMTHDKLTFRDLMVRVSFSQSSTLNLFSSKDQEYEQRAQLLKRLAFVIFCSETDQYQRYMPDIQERLSECLRLQVPVIQSQVFLCFRVLLLRLSSYHITSLWPVIITELVQIFLQMEQELSVDTEEFSSHLKRLSMMDSSWVVTNGLNAHNSPVWLQLYLSVCKLLDLALTLPAEMLPQFQIYRWAFVGETMSGISNNNMKMTAKSPSKPDFIPHITRLAKLMDRKGRCEEHLKHIPGQPLLDIRSIKAISELHPFFLTLSELSNPNATTDFRRTSHSTLTKSNSSNFEFDISKSNSTNSGNSSGNMSNLQVIEMLLEKDFLE